MKEIPTRVKAYVSGTKVYLHTDITNFVIASFKLDSKVTNRILEYCKKHNYTLINYHDGKIWTPLGELQ